MRRWVADRPLLAQSPPSHLPSCPYIQDGVALHITQPQPNTTVFLIPGLDAKQQEIPLEVENGSRVGEVYWFVDGRLLARGPLPSVCGWRRSPASTRSRSSTAPVAVTA